MQQALFAEESSASGQLMPSAGSNAIGEQGSACHCFIEVITNWFHSLVTRVQEKGRPFAGCPALAANRPKQGNKAALATPAASFGR